jgi:hypothetical protein
MTCDFQLGGEGDDVGEVVENLCVSPRVPCPCVVSFGPMLGARRVAFGSEKCREVQGVPADGALHVSCPLGLCVARGEVLGALRFSRLP